MRASTILESNNINSFIDSEVISKLLICYYRNISDNLIKLNSKLEKNILMMIINKNQFYVEKQIFIFKNIKM